MPPWLSEPVNRRTAGSITRRLSSHAPRAATVEVDSFTVQVASVCELFQLPSQMTCYIVQDAIHYLPASIALLVPRWPAELGATGSIPGQGHQQCWGGKHCLQALSSARDIKLCALCVEISAHIKELLGGQTYPQFYPLASLTVIVDL